MTDRVDTAPPEEPASHDKGSWESSHGTGRGLSFTVRIMIGFVICALVTAVIFVVVLRIEFQGQFYDYARSNVEQLALITANTLGEHVGEGGQLDSATIDDVVRSSAETANVGIQVVDPEGEVLVEAHASRDPLTGQPIVSQAPADRESAVEAPITRNGETLGYVRIWTFGAEPLVTAADARFLNNTYAALILAATAAVVLAWVYGVFMTRSLARPINHITATARAIRNGNLSARTDIKGDDELGVLAETFDEMAASLEADLSMEHRLTSDVAHELRTPLMSIIGNVEAMQDQVFPADAEHLELVAGEVRRMSRLVDGMLRLSRLENGSVPLNLERTDLVGLVRTLAESQEQLFADQGLTLRFRLDSSRPQIMANVDRDFIRQVVVNLLSNAMRYTPEGGNVVVAVGQDKDNALISVTDTGIGIEKEDLEKIFARFWRSDASRQRDSGGLGVGLSLVREIVTRHGGYVSVESEVGRGSTFTIHLPRLHGWSH